MVLSRRQEGGRDENRRCVSGTDVFVLRYGSVCVGGIAHGGIFAAARQQHHVCGLGPCLESGGKWKRTQFSINIIRRADHNMKYLIGNGRENWAASMSCSGAAGQFGLVGKFVL